MSRAPAISVIIPTFNRADAIGLTLQYLAQQTLPPEQFEVVVVDDGSTDDTRPIVTRSSCPYDLLYLEQTHRGAAAARNLGTSHARADLLLFLDSDVIVDSHFLQIHINSHQANRDTLVIGRMRPWAQTKRPWYEQVIDPESVGRDYGEQAKVLPFFYAYSCNMSVHRELFDNVGGFDESFPAAGFEDSEFAYRMEIRGHTLLYQPACIGYHNHSLTLMQRCKKEAEYAASLALLLAKHPALLFTFPGVSELMPIESSQQSLIVFWQRIRALFLSLRFVRIALYSVLTWLNNHQAGSRLAQILYWRLMTGWRYYGFHLGLQRYANLMRNSR